MTASAQQPIATASLTATNTAYTTLEALLLFHNLSTHGTHPSNFSIISNLLVKNPLVCESDSFDRGRLSPDALREFYLYLLRKEEAAGGAVNSLNTNGTAVGNGNSNGGVGDSVDSANFTKQMKERFYAEYRERMRLLIKADEDRFAKLAEEIREIEAGKWDGRLAVNTVEVSGKQRPTPPIVKPSPKLTDVENNSPEPNDVSLPPSTDSEPNTTSAIPPVSSQNPPVVLPFAPPVPEFKPQPPPPPQTTHTSISPVPVSPTPPNLQQSPVLQQILQHQESPAQHHFPQIVQHAHAQQKHQDNIDPTQNEAHRVPPVQPSQPSQPQAQDVVQPRPSTPARSQIPAVSETTNSLVGQITATPPIPKNVSSGPLLPQPLPNHMQYQTPTPTPPVAHPQSPYRMAAGYGQQPHPQPMTVVGAGLPPQYQQLPQPVPNTQQSVEALRMQQYQHHQQHQGPQQQHQFPPIRYQPQFPTPAIPQVALLPPRRPPPSDGFLQTTPAPPSSETLFQPPQVSQQHRDLPQGVPQKLELPITTIQPKPSPKHRPPPIKTDVLPLAVPPPEQLRRSHEPPAVQAAKAEIFPVTLPEEVAPRTVIQTPNRPGSPIQPGPDEISPISTPSSSPSPPDYIEAELPTGKKRSFDEDVNAEDDKHRPQTQSDQQATNAEEGHVIKRRKSMAAAAPNPIVTPSPVSKPWIAPVASAADRTAAARAASVAKRAAAKNARHGRRALAESVEPDVKNEKESDTEAQEEDIKMDEDEVEEETPEEKKVVKRRKPGKRRKSVAKRKPIVKKNRAEEDKDETADDASTVGSEAAALTAAEGEDDASNMDVDMDDSPTPKGRGQTKRKRQVSTSPPLDRATPVPTASPKLSATPFAQPLPHLVQMKSDTATSSSSLSNIIPHSPSPAAFLLPKPISTVGQQVQVIATKKFQQLSAPLLHNISAHRFANLFMAPVGERVAPGYSRLVFRPMDLKTIKAAIKNGAAAVNQLTAASNIGANSTDPPTTPSTPSSTTFPQTGQGYSSHPATILITPPKGIVNSAQLEKELFRMFANAVMYNKSNTEIVKETVEMGKEVERWVGEFRSAERVGGERARAGVSVTGISTGGWRGGPRQSFGAKAESVTSGRGAARKGKEKGVEAKLKGAVAREKDVKRNQSERQKKGEEEEEEEEQEDDREKMEDDREKMEEDGDEEGEADGDDGDAEDAEEGEEDGDAESVAETPEAEDEADDDEDGDRKSVASSSLAGSTTRGGETKRGGRGGRRGMKRGKRRR